MKPYIKFNKTYSNIDSLLKDMIHLFRSEEGHFTSLREFRSNTKIHFSFIYKNEYCVSGFIIDTKRIKNKNNKILKLFDQELGHLKICNLINNGELKQWK